MTLLKKSFQGAIYQYTGLAVTSILGFFTSVYLIKKFTVEDYGIYNFLWTIVVTIDLVTAFGITQAIQRYLPEYKQKNNAYIQKNIVIKSMLIRFTAQAIVTIIFLIGIDKLLTIFNIPGYWKPIVFITLIIALFNIESKVLGDGVLASLLQNKYLNIVNVFCKAVQLGIFYFVISMGYGLLGVILGWMLTEVILFLLYFYKVYVNILHLPVKESESRQAFPMKRFVSFGGYVYLANIAYFFTDRTADVFLLSYFIGPYAVGLYSFAFGIPLIMMRLSPASVLRSLLTPIMASRYTTAKDKGDLVYFFSFINRLTFFVMMPIFLSLIILSDKVIKYVFSVNYLEGRYLLIVSLVFIMIHQFLYSYSAIIYVLEKKRLFVISIFVGLLNLIGDVILIPLCGALGAILATGIAGIILIILFHIFIKRNLEISYPWRSFARFGLNVFIAGLVIYSLKDLITGLFSLVCIVSLGAGVYMLVSCINKGFEKRDRELINRGLGREVWVF